MTKNMTKNIWQRIALLALLLAATHTVWAQAIYRSVDPDGRTTYSDQAPPVAAPVGGGIKDAASSASGDTAAAGLPYVLREAMRRFPVTLYSGPSCGSCQTARALLAKRGVPFTENTISTQQDIDALQRIDGDTSLPLLTIGGQHLRGFLESEWNQYLDAAGYPASSQLPSGYRNAPASALAPAAPAPEPRSVERALSSPPQPQTRTPANPAGIQF